MNFDKLLREPADTPAANNDLARFSTKWGHHMNNGVTSQALHLMTSMPPMTPLHETIKCADCSADDIYNKLRGPTSQALHLMTSMPPMTSPSSLERSSVWLSACFRSRALRRTSSACAQQQNC
jgi:hypothetical protein